MRWITATLVLILALGLVACSDDADDQVAASDTTGASPERPTRLVHHNSDVIPTAAVHGTLLAEDCVILRRGDDDAVAIFPDRAKLEEDGVELDGQLFRFDSSVALSGGEVKNNPEFLAELGGDNCGLTVGMILGSAE